MEEQQDQWEESREDIIGAVTASFAPTLRACSKCNGWFYKLVIKCLTCYKYLSETCDSLNHTEQPFHNRLAIEGFEYFHLQPTEFFLDGKLVTKGISLVTAFILLCFIALI